MEEGSMMEYIEPSQEELDDVKLSQKCCICQESITNETQAQLSSCNHEYHFDCIFTWSNVTNTCPLCKTQFNTIKKVVDSKEIHIPDRKQVVHVDNSFAAATIRENFLELLNSVRCQICATDSNEHVLLLCEAPGCMNASHTYCIGLSSVPSTAWFCSLHTSSGSSRQSSAVNITLSSNYRQERRRRRLLSTIFNPVAQRRALRAVYMFSDSSRSEENSLMRELGFAQRRVNEMMARGDLTSNIIPNNNPLRRGRSLASGQSWNQPISNQISNIASGTVDLNSTSRSREINLSDLIRRMKDAASHDEYASSVHVLLPSTARLRMSSSLKESIRYMTAHQQIEFIELGCLNVLSTWIYVENTRSSQLSIHPQVLDAILYVLETLQLRVEDIQQAYNSLPKYLKSLAQSPSTDLNLKGRINRILNRWETVMQPSVSGESITSNSNQRISSIQNVPQTLSTGSNLSIAMSQALSISNDPNLPAIQPFTAQQQEQKNKQNKSIKAKLKKSTQKAHSRSATHQKREFWNPIAVEYVKGKLYPLYKRSKSLSKNEFKTIVRNVVHQFQQESQSLQSSIVEPSAETQSDGNYQLTSFAKSRLKVLLDQHYKNFCSGVLLTDHIN